MPRPQFQGCNHAIAMSAPLLSVYRFCLNCHLPGQTEDNRFLQQHSDKHKKVKFMLSNRMCWGQMSIEISTIRTCPAPPRLLYVYSPNPLPPPSPPRQFPNPLMATSSTTFQGRRQFQLRELNKKIKLWRQMLWCHGEFAAWSQYCSCSRRQEK